MVLTVYGVIDFSLKMREGAVSWRWTHTEEDFWSSGGFARTTGEKLLGAAMHNSHGVGNGLFCYKEEERYEVLPVSVPMLSRVEVAPSFVGHEGKRHAPARGPTSGIG